MIIGIDIDEVLAELTDKFLEFYNEKYGADFKRQDVKSYNLWEVWKGTREESIDKFYEFYNSFYFESIEPVKDSIESIHKLGEKHELHLITARPNEVKKNTFEWIKKHHVRDFVSINFTNHWGVNAEEKTTKGDICKKLGIQVMVEDGLHYAEEIASHGVKVLLFDCPWNQSDSLPENIERVYSWKDVMKIISSLEKPTS